MSIQISIGLVLTTLCCVTGEAQIVEPAKSSSVQSSVRLSQFAKSREPNAEYAPPDFRYPRGLDQLVADAVWPPMPLKDNPSMIATVAGGEIVEGLQLSAQPKQYQVEVLAPIVVEIKLKNTTDKAIEIYPTNVDEKDFVAQVKDVMGSVVPLTVYGKLFDPNSPQMPYSGNLILGRQKTEIKPNQEFAYELTINQINDMSLSGSYFVTIKSSLVKDLESNLVQIDVFPRNQLPQPLDVAATVTKK